MESTHRAKIELAYTKTIKQRYLAKVAVKVAEYDDKIERLEAEIAAANV